MLAPEQMLSGWIPYKLIIEDKTPVIHWLYVGNIFFSKPFFEDSIASCRSLPYNSSKYKCVSSIDSMIEWADEIQEGININFIFHISRCGSTLLSQLIGLDDKYTVLAEVPLFDEILRVHYKLPTITDVQREKILQAAIKLVGTKRTGREEQLFIKTDSWHICFYEKLKRLYPNAPVILLYRSPDEVLYSHQKFRGMHAVPNIIEPQVLGFTKKEIEELMLDVYTAKVLERYMLLFEEVTTQDRLALLLDYKQGAMDMIGKIGVHAKINWEEWHILQMKSRSNFHSKYPQQKFKKEIKQDDTPEYLKNAMEIYYRLDKIRKNQNSLYIGPHA